jgi:hypothetical protein
MTATTLPFHAQAEAEAPSSAQPGDDRLWSVTTITKTVGTPDGLIYWSLGRAADCALDDAELIATMAERDRELARRYLIDARWRPRRGLSLTDAEVGTWFHSLAEEWVVTGARPPRDRIVALYPGKAESITPGDLEAVEALLNSFDVWLGVHQPEYHAAELVVYNPTHRYAGCLDGIATMNRDRWLLDYKTSLDRDADQRKGRKRPFNTSALQLTGYRFATFAAVWRARRYEVHSRRYYLLNDEERSMALPMPQVDGGLVVHITPDHADSIRVECSEDTFRDGFRAALAAARWCYLFADDALDIAGAHELNVRR